MLYHGNGAVACDDRHRLPDAVDQCCLLYEGSDINPALREYLISVTSVAIVCGSAYAFFNKNSTQAVVIKLLCGIILSICVIRPVLGISLSDIAVADHFIEEEMILAAVTEGEAKATQEQKRIIAEQVNSYILNKSKELGVRLQVTVTLEQNSPYAPIGVELKGSASPYAKKTLSDWIQATFNIPKEAQVWTG